MKSPNRRLPIITGLALCAALALAGCAPGGIAPGPSASSPQIDSRVTPEDVAELGDVTLSILADSGEEKTLAAAKQIFEKKYSNVRLNITVKGFDDLMKTVVNVMASKDGPDVVQGNQGYAVDGALVQAGLIRPLDDIAAAYDWGDTFGEADLDQFRWTEGGATFGDGALYGVSPVDEFVGVFYSKSKLAELGLQPPQTFDEFQAGLAAAKKVGEVPLMLGNSSKYPANQVFSVVQSAFEDPDDVRSWITGQKGASYVVPGNLTAAETMRGWVSSGYVVDGYDGISPDDAVAQFSSGTGVFFVGGSWNATALAAADAAGFGFVAAPAGEGGQHSGPGSLGLGWHINARTNKLPAAIAFIDTLTDVSFAQHLADLNRIPVAAAEVSSPNALFTDEITASKLIREEGGSTFYVDWASDTMADTAGSRLQEMLAGRIPPQDYLNAVQTDWEAFQQKRGATQ